MFTLLTPVVGYYSEFVLCYLLLCLGASLVVLLVLLLGGVYCVCLCLLFGIGFYYVACFSAIIV